MEKKFPRLPDFEGSPIEFLEMAYRSSAVTPRSRVDSAVFLVNYYERQQDKKDKYTKQFKGLPLEFLEAVFKDKDRPVNERLECAKYISTYEQRERQLSFDFGNETPITINVQPVTESNVENGISIEEDE